MKENDEYIQEVNKRIAEDNDPSFRRSINSGKNRQIVDPSREITPYTRINLATSSKQADSTIPKRSQLDINY